MTKDEIIEYQQKEIECLCYEILHENIEELRERIIEETDPELLKRWK